MSKPITLAQWASILPYGVKVEYTLSDVINLSLGQKDEIRYKKLDIHSIGFCFNHCIPHLRPLSSLTKEITVDGYNDGKPFVPITWLQEEYTNHILEFEPPDCILLKEDYSFEQNVLGAPLAIIQKLLEWHFAAGFEEGQYIPIED